MRQKKDNRMAEKKIMQNKNRLRSHTQKRCAFHHRRNQTYNGPNEFKIIAKPSSPAQKLTLICILILKIWCLNCFLLVSWSSNFVNNLLDAFFSSSLSLWRNFISQQRDYVIYIYMYDDKRVRKRRRKKIIFKIERHVFMGNRLLCRARFVLAPITR